MAVESLVASAKYLLILHNVRGVMIQRSTQAATGMPTELRHRFAFS
jgi:hypothetical protein